MTQLFDKAITKKLCIFCLYIDLFLDQIKSKIEHKNGIFFHQLSRKKIKIINHNIQIQKRKRLQIIVFFFEAHHLSSLLIPFPLYQHSCTHTHALIHTRDLKNVLSIFIIQETKRKYLLSLFSRICYKKSISISKIPMS